MMALTAASCNDVGICVVDVTDVDFPAYCFVRQPGGPVLSAHQLLRLTNDYGMVHAFRTPERVGHPDGVFINPDVVPDPVHSSEGRLHN